MQAGYGKVGAEAISIKEQMLPRTTFANSPTLGEPKAERGKGQAGAFQSRKREQVQAQGEWSSIDNAALDGRSSEESRGIKGLDVMSATRWVAARPHGCFGQFARHATVGCAQAIGEMTGKRSGMNATAATKHRDYTDSR